MTEQQMTPHQALSFLCSAIRCGEVFDGHHSQAAEIIRAALSHAEEEACQTCGGSGLLGERPTHQNPDDAHCEPCPNCSDTAPQVATGWRTIKDGAEWPKQGALYLIKLNGVLQNEVYEFDQADDGGFGGGQHFWSREDLDECPPFDPERDEWLPLKEAGALAAPQVAVPEGWRHALEEALAMMTSQSMTLERQADAVTGIRDLLAAPTAPTPTKGEEIHVNVDGDSVYTLPLEPTGMAAPRFVVHVPAPTAPAPDEREMAVPSITAIQSAFYEGFESGLTEDDGDDAWERSSARLRAGKEGQ